MKKLTKIVICMIAIVSISINVFAGVSSTSVQSTIVEVIDLETDWKFKFDGYGTMFTGEDPFNPDVLVVQYIYDSYGDYDSHDYENYQDMMENSSKITLDEARYQICKIMAALYEGNYIKYFNHVVFFLQSDDKRLFARSYAIPDPQHFNWEDPTQSIVESGSDELIYQPHEEKPWAAYQEDYY